MDFSFSDLNFNSVVTDNVAMLSSIENLPASRLAQRLPSIPRQYSASKLWIYASVMNIQEFYADFLGLEFCRAISYALNPDIMCRAVTL